MRRTCHEPKHLVSVFSSFPSHSYGALYCALRLLTLTQVFSQRIYLFSFCTVLLALTKLTLVQVFAWRIIFFQELQAKTIENTCFFADGKCYFMTIFSSNNSPYL